MAVVEIDQAQNCYVDWGWRDKVGGWTPLKKSVTANLVGFGFQEKQIAFVPENERMQTQHKPGDYLIELWSPLKPSVIIIRQVTETQQNLAVMRQVAELDIVSRYL